jgi:hypothetical protein
MRRLALAAMIVSVSFGEVGASFAQLAPTTPGAGAAGTTMLTPAGSGLRPRLGTINTATLLGTSASPLGGIQLNTGSLVSSQAGAIGGISTCPAPGIANSPSNPGAIAAADAAGGIVGATPTAPAFGTASMSGICTPTISGAAPTTTAPIDSNAAATFGNGALPLDATEIGGTGLSPEIVVPPPAISSSGCSGTTTTDPSSLIPQPGTANNVTPAPCSGTP